jgi:cbb3-type cytochrome oxidase maturation protein
MGVIVLLITISVTIAVVFLTIFYWNMKSGQYDDTYTPSVRMLFDDTKPAKETLRKNPAKKTSADKSQVFK